MGLNGRAGDAQLLPSVPLDPDLTLPRVATTLRTMANGASVIPVVVGALALIGWSMDVEALKRIVPGLTAMNPATAIGFICLGWSLGVLSAGLAGPVRLLAQGLALLTVVFGLSRVAALLGFGDLQLDQVPLPGKAPVRRLRASESNGAEHGNQLRAARDGAGEHRSPDRPVPAGATAVGHRGRDLLARADGLRVRPAPVLRHRLEHRDGAADGRDLLRARGRRALRPSDARHHGGHFERQQRRHDGAAAAAGGPRLSTGARRPAPGRPARDDFRYRLRPVAPRRGDHDGVRGAGRVERAAALPIRHRPEDRRSDARASGRARRADAAAEPEALHRSTRRRIREAKGRRADNRGAARRSRSLQGGQRQPGSCRRRRAADRRRQADCGMPGAG